MDDSMNPPDASAAAHNPVDGVLIAAAGTAHTWARAAPADRARALAAVADTLEEARPELIATADRESHLGTARLNGELTRTTFQLRLFADQARSGAYYDVRIDRADPNWPTGPRPELRRYRTALGPVLVFAASNFPFAFSVAGGDTASALAAGCPVVVKAHPGHPELSRETAAIVRRALAGAGAPDGVFALIEGEQAGLDALRHPALRAAAFTGSERGGLFLARIAADRPEPIPFYGELGSTNPVVVTERAAYGRTQEIASGYAASLTLGAGQFCTNPGLLFVPAGEHGLVERIAALLRAAPTAPMLGNRIAEGYRTVAEQLSGLSGARRLVWPADDHQPAPRLLAMDVDAFVAAGSAASAECFGPLGLIVTYRQLADLVPVLAALPGQLTASVQGELAESSELGALTAVLADRSGRVLWNQWPTGVSVTHAMQHGGPFPATTTPTTTSVGSAAIERFLRPVAYQGVPQDLLPVPLRDDNPWNVPQQEQKQGVVDAFVAQPSNSAVAM
ncbi:aldehyde dehydrogenase (NADP(+)) [Streptomyces zagrosensis]|uniref:NADP-dependent aldehyde dehydrogenase n=1 Tax=Streptomyces zagrosensis TaxID=1042984 RepID=A0A7W9QA29_9ACTN|nr:aldehyde dehydrogenase (NADP(+)) [Streptomyces zagrosensis]MBB5936159.1 NADP-dependent aldehyde dehydrogenase [Streptomyces zagrosensis]